MIKSLGQQMICVSMDNTGQSAKRSPAYRMKVFSSQLVGNPVHGELPMEPVNPAQRRLREIAFHGGLNSPRVLVMLLILLLRPCRPFEKQLQLLKYECEGTVVMF
jgi:hypothetical protein